jgi:hypothetical protein
LSIIDETYFIDDITLPTDSDAQLNKLNRFIAKTEKNELIRILGYELWKLFNAELPIPTSQRFIDILNGAEFEDNNGNTDKWNGLSNADLESFLAYFTYVNATTSNQLSASGQGATSNLFENAQDFSPISKQATAWNEGVCLYNKLHDFLTANDSDYPEWVDSGKIDDFGNELNI